MLGIWKMWLETHYLTGGKNQGHITKTQITEIVHALSLAVNVFLNLSAMNFENYSTTLTNSSISLNAKKKKKKKKKNQYVSTPGVDYHFQRNKCLTLENILCTYYSLYVFSLAFTTT